MFTVCPKCALTLVVTAADLRIAQGYVRCGRCLNVFNALSRLSEDRPPAAAPPDTAAEELSGQTAPEQPSASPTAVDETGEIEIELDASAVLTPEPPAPQKITEPQAQPEAPESGATEPEAPPPAAAAPPAAAPPAAAPPAAATAATAPSAAAPPATAEQAPSQPTPEAPEESAAPMPAVTDPAVSAAATDETNMPREAPEGAFELGMPPPRAGLAWKVGAGALVIALALQIINHDRDSLAAHPALRSPLTSIYSALGVKIAPRWNIRAYEVRQLGASVAGAAAGEIVVRASVKNSAASAQPLPLLRVTLQDRFGNHIAARDVPPGDYLPSPVAPSSLLAAGSRVDATMVFVDPGPQAVGFEIDACLPERSGEVACAHGP